MLAVVWSQLVKHRSKTVLSRVVDIVSNILTYWKTDCIKVMKFLFLQCDTSKMKSPMIISLSEIWKRRSKQTYTLKSSKVHVRAYILSVLYSASENAD